MKNKYNSGYSLIELLVGCIIATLASTFLMYGISSSMSSVEDIRLEQDALEELIAYTNNWQSYVSAGYDPPEGTQPVYGDLITIGDDDLVEARLYHNITEQYTGQYSKYYNIKTWIVWNHSYLTGKKNERLEFEVNQIVF